MMIRRFVRLSSALAEQQKPSGLMQQIQSDLKTAMLAKDKTRTTVLKSLLSELNYSQKSPNPQDPFSIIRKSVKKREESIKVYQEAKRDDLASQELSEIEIVKCYLPKQLSTEEIEERLKNLIVGFSAKDMGKVMQLAKETLKAEASSGDIAAVVKSMLK